MESPEEQLKVFIDKFTSTNAALIRAVRKAMRKRLPTANEMVYDNYNFFVIGYSPTERPSECFVSIAASAKGVAICFLHGAKLEDPEGLLMGDGKQTRFLRIPDAGMLLRADVEALMAQAIARSKAPLRANGKGKLIIRSVSEKQRPRQ